MMAHNVSAHTFSAINHRLSPYLNQDHMITSRHIPILSVPEILEAFQQAQPPSNSNGCGNSHPRSIGTDMWELPELKWLDPADNAAGENVNEDEKYGTHSLISAVPDAGGKWPFSTLYADDRPAPSCPSAADDSLAQFALQAMVTSPASSGSSVIIKSNNGVLPSRPSLNKGSKVLAGSSGSQPPDRRCKNLAAISSESQSRLAQSHPPDSNPVQEKSTSDRIASSVVVADPDDCLREGPVPNGAFSAPKARCPLQKRRKLQTCAIAVDRNGKGSALAIIGAVDQKVDANNNGKPSFAPMDNQISGHTSHEEASMKSAAAGTTPANVTDHDIHIWTERERRKKMNGMFSTLHSLLPHLQTKADKSTIVDEAINYIQSLQVNLKGLLKRKNEELNCRGGLVPSALLHVRTSQDGGMPMAAGDTCKAPHLDEMKFGGAVQANPCAGSCSNSATSITDSQKFQTLCSPNIVLNICGTNAFITICSPRERSGLLCRLLFVMESHGLHVLNANISTTDDTNLYMLHAQAADENQFANPDMRMVAMQDLTNCLTPQPKI